MVSRTTTLQRAGRPHSGWVNPPLARGSTYLFASLAEWRDARQRREVERVLSYGARGTDTAYALEDALVALEDGHRAKLYPTGLAAIASTLMAFVQQGDHLLVSDAVYEPVRRFCARRLAPLGVTTTYYRPDGSDLAEKIQPNTRVIYVEAPGSLTYDMVDLPALSRLDKPADCVIIADNTWGSGLLYNPLSLGADVSVIAATKYLCGHSDVVMGATVANERTWQAVDAAATDLGQNASPDDAYQILRGLRTLPLRLAAHGAHALAVAQWLQAQPTVHRVLCPALPEDPAHALWARDCHGTNGLLTVQLRDDLDQDAAAQVIDACALFGLGASWGGYESLIMPVSLAGARSLPVPDARAGAMLRLHVGLEDPDDLIADLAQAFARLN